MSKARIALGLLVTLVLPPVLSAILRPIFPELGLPAVLLTSASELGVSFASVTIATACGAVIARGRFFRPALAMWAVANLLMVGFVTYSSIEMSRVSGQSLERPFLNVVGFNAPTLIATLLATAVGVALGEWLVKAAHAARGPGFARP